MTLPPERITIKRRREDEPVEALCTQNDIKYSSKAADADRILDIEQKRHCSSSTCWVRVRDEKPFDVSPIISPRANPGSVIHSNNYDDASSPKTPKSSYTKDVTVAPPSSSEQIIQNAQEADQVDKLSTQPIPPDQGKPIHDKKSSSSRPRIFHLSNKSKTVTAQSMVSAHRVKKSRSSRRELAVFEEKLKSARDLRDLNAEVRKGTDPPVRGIATLRGGEETHTNSQAQVAVSLSGDISVTECSPKALDGDQALSRLRKVDEFTECPSQAGLHETPKEQISDTSLQPQMKSQPKPATAVREGNRAFATALEDLPDAQDSESQDDFVYDTYLRTKPAMVGFRSDWPMDIDQLNIVASGKVGILVIAEQDEEAWEAYGEDEESDKDWNSEEEDENGIFSNLSKKVG